MVIEMKMNIKNIFSAVAAAAMLTACVGDLDTIPLNPTDVTSETAYGADEAGYLSGLTKLYYQFVSNDTQDLKVTDGLLNETVELYRPFAQINFGSSPNDWKAAAEFVKENM